MGIPVGCDRNVDVMVGVWFETGEAFKVNMVMSLSVKVEFVAVGWSELVSSSGSSKACSLVSLEGYPMILIMIASREGLRSAVIGGTECPEGSDINPSRAYPWLRKIHCFSFPSHSCI